MASGARLVSAARARLLPHAVVILLACPAVSILASVRLFVEHPLMRGVPSRVALAGMLAAGWEMVVELLAVGVLMLAASVALFSAAATVRAGRDPRLLRFAEPVVFLLAALLGVALEYPVVLRHPVVMPLRALTVADATLLLTAVVAASALAAGARRSPVATLAAALLVVGGAWRLALPAGTRAPEAPARTAVLFGVDSLSQSEDVSLLRDFVARHGGTWWERPVTPGLLTNVVWPAILMHRPARETGAVFIYQTPDWSRSPYHLVREARAAGCLTVSRFSDQFTTYVGSRAGFDRDRSGPIGWKQIATAQMKDGSVFLPVFLPRLPRLPGAGTPPNQSGTFAFDVRAEIRAILTDGAGAPRSLVAAHLDYLHQERYPGFADLTAEERSWVRRAPVDALRDLSLHWQYPSVAGEPLGLYDWKIAHVQRLIVEEISATRFLDPAKENRLLVFSDHGNRAGATIRNFGEARYTQVVLAGFGVPADDPRAPISLVDLGPLLGFPDGSRPEPAAPVVEYTNVTSDEWRRLLRTSTLRPSGEIDIEPAILEIVGARMRSTAPHAAVAEYAPSPALPRAEVVASGR